MALRPKGFKCRLSSHHLASVQAECRKIGVPPLKSSHSPAEIALIMRKLEFLESEIHLIKRMIQIS